MMPMHTLDFLEEPIRDETPEAYEALRKMTPIPFAIGEEFASKWQFLPYIERGITNFARVDVCNVGGLTEAMKVAGWAEAHYIDLMPHNPLGPICVAATAHLATAVTNFSWLEIRESPTEKQGFYDKEIFPVQPELRGDKVFLSDAPGLGIEVDEASLERAVQVLRIAPRPPPGRLSHQLVVHRARPPQNKQQTPYPEQTRDRDRSNRKNWRHIRCGESTQHRVGNRQGPRRRWR